MVGGLSRFAEEGRKGGLLVHGQIYWPLMVCGILLPWGAQRTSSRRSSPPTGQVNMTLQCECASITIAHEK
jgi:hypothetical protein